MKFCPVVPEICRGQVHVPRKERKEENNNNNKKRSKNNKYPKGTCKVRNEIETKPNETKSNETKRNEFFPKRNVTKKNEKFNMA